MTEERALYATQGGGYAVFENGRYVWHSEIPNFIHAQPGDPIPEEWSVVGINQAARDEADLEMVESVDRFMSYGMDREHSLVRQPVQFWLTEEGYFPPGM